MTYFKIFTILFIFTIGFSNCKHENNPNYIIPKDKFIDLLIDIHKTDALLNSVSMTDNKLDNQDSLSYYNKIFQDYGITRAQFYNTFGYYTENMAEFLELQKIVMDSLSVEFKLLDSLERLSLQNQDLWTLKREWILPEDGVTNSIPYKHPTQKAGNYRITAEIMSYSDDLSKDLHFKIGAYYNDGTEDIKTTKIKMKTAQWDNYSLTVSINPAKTLSYIEVEILAHSHKTTYMHVQVRGIMLTFEDLSDTQSSIDSVQ